MNSTVTGLNALRRLRWHRRPAPNPSVTRRAFNRPIAAIVCRTPAIQSLGCLVPGSAIRMVNRRGVSHHVRQGLVLPRQCFVRSAISRLSLSVSTDKVATEQQHRLKSSTVRLV